jgi:hypothetical protein
LIILLFGAMVFHCALRSAFNLSGGTVRLTSATHALSLAMIAALAGNFLPQMANAQGQVDSGLGAAPSGKAQQPTAASAVTGKVFELIATLPIVPFDQISNRDEPTGDRLGEARRMAAAVLAQDKPAPKLVVDVGSFTGAFLEAFLEQFPGARGQWTEPVPENGDNARRRLARFGGRVDYVIGCPARDISLGCVPAGVDVLITSWLSIHQDLKGIRKFYRDASAMLPSGGWIVNEDHVGFRGGAWQRRLKSARIVAASEGLAAKSEGPAVHHADWVIPTLEDQMAALKAAGITDVQVVWRRLDTVVIMGRKK